MSAPSERRILVNAAVVAGSAVMFAAAWLGIVRSDTRAAGADLTTAVAPIEAFSPASAASMLPAEATSATEPAPAPTRRIVVVRQSRAS